MALTIGKPISGYMDFGQNVFLEENEIRRESYVAFAQMMEHMMEIEYCTYYIAIEGLEKECEEYREKVIMYTEWYRRVKDTHVITYLTDELGISRELSFEQKHNLEKCGI